MFLGRHPALKSRAASCHVVMQREASAHLVTIQSAEEQEFALTPRGAQRGESLGHNLGCLVAGNWAFAHKMARIGRHSS